jgi:hypothetical protein
LPVNWVAKLIKLELFLGILQNEDHEIMQDLALGIHRPDVFIQGLEGARALS